MRRFGRRIYLAGIAVGVFTVLGLAAQPSWASGLPPLGAGSGVSAPGHHVSTQSERPRIINGTSLGVDLVGSDGGVFVFPTYQEEQAAGGGIGQFGTVGFFGSLPGLGIAVNNVVGMVPTNDDQGYDLVGSDGGVFVFPTNQPRGFYGSLPALGIHVNNIVGMVPTATDNGYFLVGSDGGVFAFPPSTPFSGSLPGLGIHVNDIVGIAPTADNNGYWLVSSAGTVYAIGDAVSYGDLGGTSSTPIVGIASTSDSKGYWLVGKNGSVYNFGDASALGGLPQAGTSVNNIVAIFARPNPNQVQYVFPTWTAGYDLIGSDGSIYEFPGGTASPDDLPAIGVSVNNVVGAVPVPYQWSQA